MAEERLKVVIIGEDKLSPVMKKGAGSITDFKSALDLASKATQTIGQVYDEVIGKYLTYTDSVRQLSSVTGASAEETSRLLQVVDDFGIEAGQVTTAMRAMRDEGLVPTMDSLAQLSDQYIALAPGVDRANFLQERFGRGGAEFAVVLEQGSAALRKRAAEVQKGLIVDEKALRDAQELKWAEDDLQDTWRSTANLIAQEAVPALLSLVDALEAHRQQMQFNDPILRLFNSGIDEQKRLLEEGAAAHEAAAKYVAKFGENLPGAADYVLAYKDKLNEAALAAGSLATQQYLANFQIGQVAVGAEGAIAAYEDYLTVLGNVDLVRLQDAFGAVKKAQEAGFLTADEAHDMATTVGIEYADELLESGIWTQTQRDTYVRDNYGLTHKQAQDWATAHPVVIPVTFDYRGPGTGGVPPAPTGHYITTWTREGSQQTWVPGPQFGGFMEDYLKSKQWFLVGERGYELVDPTGYVHPHEESVRLLPALGQIVQPAAGGYYIDGFLQAGASKKALEMSGAAKAATWSGNPESGGASIALASFPGVGGGATTESEAGAVDAIVEKVQQAAAAESAALVASIPASAAAAASEQGRMQVLQTQKSGDDMLKALTRIERQLDKLNRTLPTWFQDAVARLLG